MITYYYYYCHCYYLLGSYLWGSYKLEFKEEKLFLERYYWQNQDSYLSSSDFKTSASKCHSSLPPLGGSGQNPGPSLSNGMILVQINPPGSLIKTVSSTVSTLWHHQITE